MGNLRCNWIRDRLPLLAGDDLRGPDRRRVESHLVACPSCRLHLASLAEALRVLEAAAAVPPARPEAPSLWPELARQIRESRRPGRGPTFDAPFPFSFSWPSRFPAPRLSFWPAFGLGLGLLAAFGVTAAVRHQAASARSAIAAGARPIPTPAPLPVLVEEVPSPDPEPSTPVAENPPPRPIDYADQATPAAPEPREVKTSF